MAMNMVDVSLAALVSKALQLVYIAQGRGNETAIADERFRFIEHPVLLFIPDRYFSVPSAVGPTRLENQPVTSIRPGGPDLDRLGPPQTKCGLEPERYPGIRIADLLQVGRSQLPCLAHIGNVLAIRDTVVRVVLRDDVLLANLLGPPAKRRHAVLHRAR